MAEGLLFNEAASVATPAASKVNLYADNTANPQLLFKDDGGNLVSLLDGRNTVAQIGSKDFADGTTTISNVSATSKAIAFSLSGMTAAVVLTLASTQSTSRTLSIPNITAADTLMTLGLTQVVTGGITFSSATLGFGYATGAGGAVTQLTSKATATPAINKMCGTVTMNNAALAADTSVAHTLTNSSIAANDNVIITHSSGGTLGAYTFACTPGAGSATVNVHNCTPGSLSEAVVYRFTVIKGVVA